MTHTEGSGEDLARWLKSRMAERNLGRNELVRASGLSAGTISRITVLNYVPGVETLNRLADFFGADRETLLEIAGVVRLTDLEGDLPFEVRDLARRLFRLDARSREAILRQFDGILKLVEDLPPR